MSKEHTTCTISGCARPVAMGKRSRPTKYCAEHLEELRPLWAQAKKESMTRLKNGERVGKGGRKRKTVTAAPAPEVVAEQPRRMVQAVTPLPSIAPMRGCRCKGCGDLLPFNEQNFAFPAGVDIRRDAGLFWAAFSWTCRNCDGSAVKPQPQPEQGEAVPTGGEKLIALVSADDKSIQRFRATLTPVDEGQPVYPEGTTHRGAAVLHAAHQDGFLVYMEFDLIEALS